MEKLPEEVRGHDAVAVRVGMALLLGGLPAPQPRLGRAVAPPREKPDVLLARDLAVGLRPAQVQTTPGLEEERITNNLLCSFKTCLACFQPREAFKPWGSHDLY